MKKIVGVSIASSTEFERFVEAMKTAITAGGEPQGAVSVVALGITPLYTATFFHYAPE